MLQLIILIMEYSVGIKITKIWICLKAIIIEIINKEFINHHKYHHIDMVNKIQQD